MVIIVFHFDACIRSSDVAQDRMNTEIEKFWITCIFQQVNWEQAEAATSRL